VRLPGRWFDADGHRAGRSRTSRRAVRSSWSTTEDRENEGRPHLRGGRRRPRSCWAFMGPLHVRLRLRRADRSRGGPAGTCRRCTTRNQDRRGGTAYSVTGGRRRGHQHRHLRRRPRRAHHPAARRPGVGPRRTSASRSRRPRLRAKRRRACSRRPRAQTEALGFRPVAVGLAGLAPAGVLCEIRVRRRTRATWPRRDELEVFAADHDLAIITIRRPDRLPPPAPRRQVERVAEARIPAGRGATFPRGSAYDSLLGRHRGTSRSSTARSVTARTSWSASTPSCLTGDGLRLPALRLAGRSSTPRWPAVAAEGRGVVLYIRGPRGAAASACCTSLQAYQLQDDGADNRRREPSRWGCPPTPVTTATGAQILCDPGCPHHAACCRTTRPSGSASRATGLRGQPGGCRCRSRPNPENPWPLTLRTKARPDGPRPGPSWSTTTRSARGTSTPRRRSAVSGEGRPDLKTGPLRLQVA